MTTEMLEPTIEAEGLGNQTLADARFIRLTTFRRSGVAVSTPVLFVIDDDRILVRTAIDSGKVKRLRNDSTVEIAPSDSRGEAKGESIRGTATILGSDAVQPMLAKLHARYRIAGPLFSAIRRLRGQGDIVLEIMVAPAAFA